MYYLFFSYVLQNILNIDCRVRFEPVMGAPKQKWTQEEESALKSGVVKHGPGKWRTILKDPEFSGVLYLRSNVDLKVHTLFLLICIVICDFFLSFFF